MMEQWAAGEEITAKKLLQTGVCSGGTATGAVNTFAIAPDPSISAYVDQMAFTFKANLAVTGAATLNVNGKGAKAIRKYNNQPLEKDDIVANQIVAVVYNSTNDVFDMISPTANMSAAVLFGDGNDGDVTISGNTSLTRDMYYNNLTVNNGVTLTTAGYRVFVKGILTNNGTIGWKGNDGAAGGDGVDGEKGGIGGAAGAAGTEGAELTGTNLPGGVAGKAGKAGAAGANGNAANGTNGTAGDAGTSLSNSIGSAGNAGKASGDGGLGGADSDVGRRAGGTGAAGGAAGSVSGAAKVQPRQIHQAVVMRDADNTTQLTLNAGNGGAAGGASAGPGVDDNHSGYAWGDGSGGGGGGGGGGGNGGACLIFARTILNAGTITVAGGDGGKGGDGGDGGAIGGSPSHHGAGGSGGGGGGNGGNGGLLVLAYAKLTDSGTITVAGGAAGAKGVKGVHSVRYYDVGIATDGTDGTAGAAGVAGIRIDFAVV